MPSKLQSYTQMAGEVAAGLTKSYQKWTAFLTTASRLYKYPFPEQMMIFAQRPDATACAEYDLWNNTMNRYVRRGSKGIALIDDSGYRPRLRYVFDVSDTGARENARQLNLWQYRPEHEAAVSSALDTAYGIPLGNGLPDQLEKVAARLAGEYWQEHGRDILDIVDGSFLEEYDDLNIQVAFRGAATVSITYALMARCGLEPENYFEHEDFLGIFDFNTAAVVNALGTAVSQSSQEVLRQIGVTIRHYEYERRNEHERIDLHPEGGLPVPEPGADGTGTGEAPGQVREDAESVPEGASPGSLQQPSAVRQPDGAPSGDRRDGTGPDGGPGEGAVGAGGRDGEPESRRPDEMGGADEQLQGTGRGNDPDGTYIQLTLPLFPTEEEQIQHIETAESVKAPSAFTFSQDDIDTELRSGSGTRDGKLRIHALYQHQPDAKTAVDFLKDEYGWYGHSLTFLDGSRGFADYSPRGLQLRHSETSIETSLKWNAIEKRLRALVAEGSYLTEAEKAAYASLEQDYAGIPGGVPMPHARAGFPTPQAAAPAQPAPETKRTEAEKVHEPAQASPEPKPAVHEPAPASPKDPQDAIDDALREWNGNIASKQAVVRYMKDHARDKGTAEWLKQEYGDDLPAFPVTSEGASTDLPWPKVQRRIAQLIREGRFYTEAERDNLDDIDPIAIREELERRGIVNGRPVTRQGDTITIGDVPETAAESAPARDPLSPAYQVGDTVYLDDTAFEITEIHGSEVQLRDPSLLYPIFRAESRERFESLLQQDPRNGHMSEFLTKNLERIDADLREVLASGLLSGQDKDYICGWFRAGEGNTRVAQRLSELYAGKAETMQLITGEAADYFTSTAGISVEIQDKYGSRVSASWGEVASVLRTFYQQELDGFSHEQSQRETVHLEGRPVYQVGDQVTVPGPDHPITGTIGYIGEQEVRIDTGPYSWSNEVISREQFEEWLCRDGRNAHLFQPEVKEAEGPVITSETEAVYPGDKNGLPYDIVVERLHIEEPEHDPPRQAETPEDTPGFEESLDETPISIQIGGEWQTFHNTAAAEQAMDEERQAESRRNAQNFHITNDALGKGGPKEKFWRNIKAVATLKQIEGEGRTATLEEQHILSQYVGWGDLADVFDDSKPAWASEYDELKGLLTPEEYASARASTLNAHYTSPTVIKAIYEAVGNMGFTAGNILEPSCGIGNFFGLLPEGMAASRLYGVELDSISGRIARQLYPQAEITVAGFETTDRRDFFDLAIGNVPFGQYKVSDRAYDKLGFSIHDYFFAKSLDQVWPGGVVAFVTSRYTMDKQSPEVRRYIAERAELLGAIRLPNNAFRANAGTDVVSDIIFLQKRDRPIVVEPDWIHLGQNGDGFAINSYFVDHPEMILGRQTSESTQYGRQDFTVEPIEGVKLADQLHEAIQNILGQYREAELPELGEGAEIDTSIPADPNVKNYSYTVVDGEVYFRENSRMVKPELNATAKERVRGLVELRKSVQRLIALQMEESDPLSIRMEQAELNRLYDSFTERYGLINSRGNALAFSDDSSYYLLCSLEMLDENGNLERKADMFTKRTIKQHTAVTSVDTASEALAVSIAEKACVDMAYMSRLTGKDEQALAAELRGVIFMDFSMDGSYRYQTADEFLSGNVREKLRRYEATLTNLSPEDARYGAAQVNVEALRAAQPKDLEASEIDVRLGATWIDKEYVEDFMYELFDTPFYLQRAIHVNFSEFTAEWNITGKSAVSYNNVAAYTTYGTDRANAYRILEDTLNLRDVRIYDTVEDPDGRERRVLNQKETTLAQQKQQAIKDAFQDWIWRDPTRRQTLVRKYNDLFNATRLREYDGSHITFGGINPEIRLREHQLNAIAHVLYGGNTLLAHEVGAGKSATRS